jgi:branched-chain amino acid transport system permease protein
MGNLADNRRWVLLGMGITLLALIFLPPLFPPYVTVLLMQGLVYAIAAMSLDILVGYTGLAALGHAAFFAIGAYTAAILIERYQFGFGTTLLSSIGIAALAAAALGPLSLRATRIYFLMITLSIAMCLWGLIYRWASLTGGDNGISGIPRPELGLPWSMSDDRFFYYFILAVFVVFTLLAVRLINSPFGKTLVGIRDSESRMRVLGFNTWLHKYMAYIIAGAMAGFAGNLYAYYNGFVNADIANLPGCMKLVLMVSLGGKGTLLGPAIGAVIITFLENMVSVYTDRWLIVLGVVYVVTARVIPGGIMAILKQLGRSTKRI